MKIRLNRSAHTLASALPYTRFALPLTACALSTLATLVACGGSATPAAAPVGVITPVASAGPTLPSEFTSGAIDSLLQKEWDAAAITPSNLAPDAVWLRRVYVDIVGTIPSPVKTVQFLADTSPTKRARLVDELLGANEYAVHWMNVWDDVLMGKQVTNPQLVDRAAFRDWLYASFRQHRPWNAIAFDLLAATGPNTPGGVRRSKDGVSMPSTDMIQAAAMNAAPAAASTTGSSVTVANADAGAVVNGAVNWSLKYADSPQDYAGTASRVLLGVQIQCAQCHDHKTEKWKQADFRSFAAASLHSKIIQTDGAPDKGMIRRVDLEDFARVNPRAGKTVDGAPIASAKPVALDGTTFVEGPGTRNAFAQWMTNTDNPWFAKAFVNRMWGHFLGRGFVDPIDDIRPSNPVEAQALWDALSQDFVAHGYNVERLIRQITATRAYGLAAAHLAPASTAAPSDTAKNAAGPEIRAWSRYRMVPLGPEELLNALFAATNVEAAASRAGINNLEPLRVQLVRNFSTIFDVDEEFDNEDYEGSVGQALTLLNGALTNTGARALPGTALQDVLAQKLSDENTILALYMKVLSRPAEAGELGFWLGFVQSAPKSAPATTVAGEARKRPGKGERGNPLGRVTAGKRAITVDARQAAFEDLMWTLLNSSEFSFNH